MNLQIKLFCSLLTMMVSTALPVSSESFFKQDESIQHFVLEKDKEFRLFYHNAITLGDGARWDDKQKLTDTPCFWIEDTSDTTASSFRQHNPMLVAPCTEYVLNYMVKIDKLEGEGPSIEFILYDYNTDVISTLRFPVGIDKPAGIWIEKQVTLKTDYQTCEVILQLSSDIKGKCDVRFDKVYFKQTSEHGSLMPTPIKMMDNESAFIEHSNSNEKIFTKVELPVTRSFLKLDFDVNCKNFDSGAVVYIDWIDEYGDVIGTDYCSISSLKGVLPEWNGIAARWKRELHKSCDKASLKLDWYYDSSPGICQCNISRVIKMPQGARYAQIRIVKDDNSKGEINFCNLKFIAEY